MPVNVRGRSFLTLLDYTPAEIRYLLDLAKEFKRMKRNGVPHRYLENKNIVLLFEKTSTRTRWDRCCLCIGYSSLSFVICSRRARPLAGGAGRCKPRRAEELPAETNKAARDRIIPHRVYAFTQIPT